jgi:uncharacterized Ntn-hydrolase superfamily protein
MVATLREMNPERRERVLKALRADERQAWLEAIAEAEAAAAVVEPGGKSGDGDGSESAPTRDLR